MPPLINFPPFLPPSLPHSCTPSVSFLLNSFPLLLLPSSISQPLMHSIRFFSPPLLFLPLSISASLMHPVFFFFFPSLSSFLAVVALIHLSASYVLNPFLSITFSSSLYFFSPSFYHSCTHSVPRLFISFTLQCLPSFTSQSLSPFLSFIFSPSLCLFLPSSISQSLMHSVRLSPSLCCFPPPSLSHSCP